MSTVVQWWRRSRDPWFESFPGLTWISLNHRDSTRPMCELVLWEGGICVSFIFLSTVSYIDCKQTGSETGSTGSPERWVRKVDKWPGKVKVRTGKFNSEFLKWNNTPSIIGTVNYHLRDIKILYNITLNFLAYGKRFKLPAQTQHIQHKTNVLCYYGHI